MKNILLIVLVIVILFILTIAISKNGTTVSTGIFPKPIDDAREASSTPEVVTTPIVNETKKTTITGLYEEISFNDLILEPLEVTEDSRCPMDVQCIQAGRVVVSINIISTIDGNFVHNAEVEIDKPIIVEKTKITFVKAAPDPVSTRKITEGDYRFTFYFEVIE